MEQHAQQTSRQHSMYREIETIDNTLHRLMGLLLTLVGKREDAKSVLARTGGVLKHSYTKEDVLEWQQNTRGDWKR